MENQKAGMKFPVGAIFLLVYSLWILINDIEYFEYIFHNIFYNSFSVKTLDSICDFFVELGYIAIFAALAVLLLMKKKGIGIVVVSALMVVNWFFSYATFLIFDGFEVLQYNWPSFISTILWIVAFVALALMELADMGVKALAPFRSSAKLVFPILIGVSFLFIPLLWFVMHDFFDWNYLFMQILRLVSVILAWSWLANPMKKVASAAPYAPVAPIAPYAPAATTPVAPSAPFANAANTAPCTAAPRPVASTGLFAPLTSEKAERLGQNLYQSGKLLMFFGLIGLGLLVLSVLGTLLVSGFEFRWVEGLLAFDISSRYTFMYLIMGISYLGILLGAVGTGLYFYGAKLFALARIARNTEK